MPNLIRAKAYNYLKNVSDNWFTVILCGKDFYYAKAVIDDSSDAKELGPVIAVILKDEYGYTTATYHEASNSITVTGRTD